MRILLVIIFINFINWSFTQDTIINIYKNGRIYQKKFITKNYIKIVYEYNESGILIRRYWYNKEGKLLSVSLDD